MMTKGADGTWTLVKKLEPGKYAYKFVVDGSNWKPDPNAAETVDDGYGGKNSVITVGGGAAAGTVTAAPAPVPAAAPAKAAPAAGNGSATFTYKGDGGSVAVAGEFNGWNTSADMMTKGADGTWTLVKKLEPGKYQYKFVVDGSNWKPDPNAAETADDGYGGKNSVITVGGGAAAGNAAAGTTAAAPPATGGATAPSGKGAAPVATADGVTFTYAGAADQVALAGDFNGWSTTTDPMTKRADGSWTLTKKLAAGSYGYKFLVNGKNWKTDDANPESKDDGFGGKNSIVTVR
jgi:1,4-alpha-glucan branching enzyme